MTFIPAFCEDVEDYVYLTETLDCPNCGEFHNPLL